MRVAECGFSLSRAPALCHSDSRVGKVRAGLVKVKPVGLTHITNIPMIPTLRLTLAASICGGNNKIIPDLLGGESLQSCLERSFPSNSLTLDLSITCFPLLGLAGLVAVVMVLNII